jgi:hypothetical protein
MWTRDWFSILVMIYPPLRYISLLLVLYLGYDLQVSWHYRFSCPNAKTKYIFFSNHQVVRAPWSQSCLMDLLIVISSPSVSLFGVLWLVFTSYVSTDTQLVLCLGYDLPPFAINFLATCSLSRLWSELTPRIFLFQCQFVFQTILSGSGPSGASLVLWASFLKSRALIVFSDSIYCVHNYDQFSVL